MRRIVMLFAFGIFILTVGCATVAWERQTAKVIVSGFEMDGVRSVGVGSAGTGVFVDRKGTFVTNAHVVRRAHTVVVTKEDDSSMDASFLVSVDTSEDRDVAVLRADATMGSRDVVLAKRSDVKKGDAILAIGNSLNAGLSVLHGYITNVVKRGDADVLIVDAQFKEGASGGPVFLESGKLGGIICAFSAFPGGMMGFVVPAWEIQKVLDGIAGEQVNKELSAHYTMGEMLRRLNLNVKMDRACLKPGVGFKFPLPVAQDRDYYFSAQVLSGTVQVVIGESKVQVPAEQSFDVVVTSPVDGSMLVVLDNLGIADACLDITVSNIVW